MKTVWTIPAPSREERKFGNHPTQKPVALVRRCLEASCGRDSLVLDPFMGVGTTGVACVSTQNRFIGIELDSEYVRVARERLGLSHVDVF